MCYFVEKKLDYTIKLHIRDSLQLGAENHAKRSVEDGKFRPLRLRIAGKS